MKTYLKTIIGIASLIFLTGNLFATNSAPKTTVQPFKGEWTVSLGGSGTTVTSGDTGTSVGFDLSIGRTGVLLFPLESGLRQGVSYNGDDVTLLDTRLYSDFTLYTIKPWKVDLFTGANVGLIYGNTTPVWTIAPEGGFRWWFKKDVSLLGRIEVPFNLTEGEYTDTIKYFLGFQVKW